MSKSREMSDFADNPNYETLLQRIAETYCEGQRLAYQAVNEHLTVTNWRIGRHIVEFEQGGKSRAEYGTSLLKRLSRDLSLRLGKSFTRSGVIRIRQFYLTYPKGATASHLLSWSRFIELLKIDNPLERSFYEQQSIKERCRITLDNKHYRVDLVFYHRILRCFVLIDLKLDEVQHHDIGQMNMYLGYFAAEENTENDNPPIGIILSREKDELLVEYATYEMNSQLFVQKYQLYLPDRDELKRELENTLRIAEGFEEDHP